MSERLLVKNFGPIKEAEIAFRKITVLIGEQGSGKSTIAKLYALFTWLEKCLTRHILTINSVVQYSRFKKKYCAYHRMENYFKDNSELCFEGIHYIFTYRDGKFDIKEREGNKESFSVSKVMYVPAERIILGCVEHPSYLKGLGEAMKTFSEEYDEAKSKVKGYELPFDEMRFEYDKSNDIVKLHNEDVNIKLSEAASGFQSALPLLLVSKNLSDIVADNQGKNDLSDKERKALQMEVDFIMNENDLTEDVKMAFLKRLSSKYSYSRFVNIVEEMELNLFPSSQKAILFELVANTHKLEGNKLILTTHSPYVVNFLTLAIKAKKLSDKAQGNSELLARTNEVVPQPSQVAVNEWNVYQVRRGKVDELERYNDMPSDNNFLNNLLDDTNLAFDTLLEIEDDIEQWKKA